jgi:hypothetical protein
MKISVWSFAIDDELGARAECMPTEHQRRRHYARKPRDTRFSRDC